ncbi:hypothetical protein AB9F41_35140, partial [Rhizobium leguminosarum]|uniref:hypothetical protein n=1 Tax=Rhizobium leguminosarum TaxID=384 RepID=UPI003F966479
LVESLRPFDPVVFEWILIFQLFPRTTAVRAMQNGEMAKEIIVELSRQTLMRNRHIKPVFRVVQLLEVKGSQQFRSEQ